MSNQMNEIAYWETIYSLPSMLEQSNWPKSKLIDIALKAQINLSGWPIGVVLYNRNDVCPKAKSFGISATIPAGIDDMYDHWELHSNGSFYLFRLLEESIKSFQGGRINARVVHFDTRICRVTEALLHCQKLYQLLEVDPKEKIIFEINHCGLNQRILVPGDGRRALSMNYKCEESEHNFKKICSIDFITADLKGIVYETTKDLFEMFNWFHYPRTTCDQIVDQFISGRR